MMVGVGRKTDVASLITLCCLITWPTKVAGFQLVRLQCRPSPLGSSFPDQINSRFIQQRTVPLFAIRKNDREEAIEKESSSPTQMSTSSFVGLPSYKRIIFFVASTVVIWVSEPLLSLVDSAAVGRYASSSSSQSSVVQLAALGPATILCDSTMYLSTFISMATTNKLARAFARNDVDDQVSILSHVMGLSLAVGAFITLLINFGGANILAAIIGPASTASAETSKQVLSAALDYSRIRSIVTPLAVMGLTSQAVLLCSQDTKTPGLAVLVASLVNIIGDYLLVAKMNWGIRGAAWATTMASIIANGILVRKVWQLMQRWKNKQSQQVQDVPFLSLPNREAFTSLIKLAGPIFFVLIGKIMGYSSMTIKAGSFGYLPLACHNVLMRVFFFFATCGDALSHSAQTFLPGLLYRKKLIDEAIPTALSTTNSKIISARNDDSTNARTFLKRLLLFSVGAGIFNSLAGRYIANSAGGTFTTDSSLVALMSLASPFMGLANFIHPITMTLEGSIIAGRDAGYLVGTYVFSLVLLLSHLRYVCSEFVAVYHALLLFQIVRIIQFGLRVWNRTSVTSKKLIEGTEVCAT
jgi:Na+-driven multidrug efflux pump